MTKIRCAICDVPELSIDGALPADWALSSALRASGRMCEVVLLCSAACARRNGESELTIAALWPRDATAEGLLALYTRENEIAQSARITSNPLLAGMVFGGIFYAREQRYDARGGHR